MLGWVAWLFLAYTISMVEWTARLPHAAVALERVSPALVWGWYGIVAGGAWWMAQPVEKRQATWRSLVGRLPLKLLLGGLGLVVVLAWAAVLSLPDGKLHVTFLDAGGSDTALIETPDGKQILINGGPSPATIKAHLGRRMPFWDHTIEMVVLTDSEEAHVMGLISILERYEVGHVIENAALCESSICARWREILREKGIVAQRAVAGTQVDLGHGLHLSVLHPTVQSLAGADAGGPLVLRLDYGTSCFLFAGSADSKADAAMLARGEKLRCDVIQVASEDAASVPFLEQVRPALAVIGCGPNEKNCPDEQMLARLERYEVQVVRTDELGSIEVVSDGHQYAVRVGR
jgi:competence protein ComEC